MKSQPLGVQNVLATDHNTRRDDLRGGSFLLAHQQLGAIALPTNPSNTQTLTLTINSTAIVITFVTSIGSTPNNILIGATAAATVTNLVNFLRRPDRTTSTQVAATGGNQSLLQYCGYALPSGGTTITPFSLNKNVNGATANLSSFTASTTATGGSWTGQTMQLYVEDGAYYINGTRYLFSGGSTPTVTAPVSNPRIDVLTIDSSGTLAWTTGAENASPTAPSYPANKLAICELYNVVGETALYDNENQQANQGYISNDVRPASVQTQVPTAFASDLLPDGNSTRNLGSASFQWLTMYATTVYQNGVPIAAQKFGGTGADGALSISSGTTTLSAGSNATLLKNYTSISITGTAKLAFSNPNANGTLIILKSQGAVTLTSSTVPCIDATNMGAAGGATGAGSSTGNGPGGGGGAGANTSGSNGANGSGASASSAAGTANAAYGLILIPAGTAPGAGSNTAGVGGVSPFFQSSLIPFIKTVPAYPGAGGGAGQVGSTGAGGNGGTGGGGLYIECAGALNFTGTLSAAGAAGSNGTGNGGGGGGGGGGCIFILYTTLTANSGTLTVTGGSGGTGGGSGGAGGNGLSLVAKNTEFS